MKNKKPIRVLVADDEEEIIDAYKSIFVAHESPIGSEASALRARLFGNTATATDVVDQSEFDVTYARSAESAVQSVLESLDQGIQFAVVFLDMRMPPGKDGAWAASEIRRLDSQVDIVICTAYSDLDPYQLSREIKPASRLFFVQKPFHPYEIFQLAETFGEKRLSEDKIRDLAYYDTLTGLPNRAFFNERTPRILQHAEQTNKPVALFFLDLDNFKRINDTLGHHTGDQLLCAVADTLGETLGITTEGSKRPRAETLTSPMITRLGGDEYAIILPGISDPAEVSKIAGDIRCALSLPIKLNDHELIVTSSIGTSIFPQDGSDVHDLMRSADLAMYAAKKAGSNNIFNYDEDLSKASLRRMTMETELREALSRGELTLHYQPQQSLVTGDVCGFEALIRWENGILGKVAPLDFIPLAEETGLIVPIGDWVLKTACAQARAWLDMGYKVERMAVNVSTVQFAKPDFSEFVATVLNEVGLDPGMLELEITESVLMGDSEQAIHILQQLKTIGVQLAIDDFGTGYSSLSYLKQFPIDRLKIDKSFIDSIVCDESDQAITAAIIAVAERMNLHVIAEGVENCDQLFFLKQSHCDEVQGYEISAPLSAADAEAYLQCGGKSVDKAA